MALRISNSLKFRVLGPVLEALYARWWVRPHAELVDTLGGTDQPRRVLELCAGTGYLSRLIATAHPNASLVALDLSADMLSVGRRRLGPLASRIRLVEGDVAALPFEDAEFDTVVVAFGLHELPSSVRISAIGEAARVLEPGGQLAVVDLDRPIGAAGPLLDAYLWAMEPPDAGDVNGNGIVDLLSTAGFDLIAHRPAEGWNSTQIVLATRR